MRSRDVLTLTGILMGGCVQPAPPPAAPKPLVVTIPPVDSVPVESEARTREGKPKMNDWKKHAIERFIAKSFEGDIGGCNQSNMIYGTGPVVHYYRCTLLDPDYDNKTAAGFELEFRIVDPSTPCCPHKDHPLGFELVVEKNSTLYKVNPINQTRGKHLLMIVNPSVRPLGEQFLEQWLRMQDYKRLGITWDERKKMAQDLRVKYQKILFEINK